jgi:hypothetical protein
MKKTMRLVAVGLGVVAGSIFAAGSAVAAPQGPAVVQDSSGWPDDLASSFNDGWLDSNGGAADDDSGKVGLGGMIAGSIFQATQPHWHPQSGSGVPQVNDPDLAPATAGTVGLDTDGNSAIKTVGGDSGLSVDGNGAAPTSTVGTVNIDTATNADTAPIDCNGFWLVTPVGC